jgi:glyoxylase I family protein
MGIEITQLLHAGVRIGPSDDDVARATDFYGGLLGLQRDGERPHIPTIPGFWVNVKDGDRGQQIHIMGAEGKSRAARSDKHDPTRQHLAFAVRDLDAARQELEGRDIEFWVYEGLVGRGSDQVFFEDPFGNVIELQQDPG